MFVVFFLIRSLVANTDHQGSDFDDMSSFFHCEIDDAIQYINLGYGAQAPKILIYIVCWTIG